MAVHCAKGERSPRADPATLSSGKTFSLVCFRIAFLWRGIGGRGSKGGHGQRVQCVDDKRGTCSGAGDVRHLWRRHRHLHQHTWSSKTFPWRYVCLSIVWSDSLERPYGGLSSLYHTIIGVGKLSIRKAFWASNITMCVWNFACERKTEMIPIVRVEVRYLRNRSQAILV